MMWAHVWISVYQKEMQAVNNQKTKQNKTKKTQTNKPKKPSGFSEMEPSKTIRDAS